MDSSKCVIFCYPEMPGLKIIMHRMAGNHGCYLSDATTNVVTEGTTTAAHAEVDKRLKNKTGTVHLAPSCITEETEDALDVFIVATAAEQCLYGHRAKHVKGAPESFKWHLDFVKGAWKNILLDGVRSTVFDVSALHALHCDDDGPRGSKQSFDVTTVLLSTFSLVVQIAGGVMVDARSRFWG